MSTTPGLILCSERTFPIEAINGSSFDGSLHIHIELWDIQEELFFNLNRDCCRIVGRK